MLLFTLQWGEINVDGMHLESLGSIYRLVNFISVPLPLCNQHLRSVDCSLNQSAIFADHHLDSSSCSSSSWLTCGRSTPYPGHFRPTSIACSSSTASLASSSQSWSTHSATHRGVSLRPPPPDINLHRLSPLCKPDKKRAILCTLFRLCILSIFCLPLSHVAASKWTPSFANYMPSNFTPFFRPLNSPNLCFYSRHSFVPSPLLFSV